MWLAEIFYTSINFIAWLYVSYNIVVNIRTIFSDKVGIIRSELFKLWISMMCKRWRTIQKLYNKQWRIQRRFGGFKRTPTLVKLHKSNPLQLIWTPDPKILDPPLNKALLGYCLDVSDSPVLFCVSHFRSYYSLFMSYNRSWGQGWVPVKLV